MRRVVTGKITSDEIQLYFDKNLDTLKAVICLCGKGGKDP